jgi:hypothetical protein
MRRIGTASGEKEGLMFGMTAFMKRQFAGLAVAAALTVSGAVPATAAIIPTGVHNDVSINTVLNSWGWQIAYQDTYDNGNFANGGGVEMATVFAGVQAGDYVMLAAYQTGSSTLDVLAAALFEDVTFVTALNATHTANGVAWYYNSLSMGFAGPGDSISQTSADTAAQSERDRLSWHTTADAGRSGGVAPDELWPGWRSGNNVGLNNGDQWNRVVLVVSDAAVPSPASLGLLLAGLAAAGFVRRMAAAVR